MLFCDGPCEGNDRHDLGHHDERLHEDPPAVARELLRDKDRIPRLHSLDLIGIDHVGLASHFQTVPQWREFTGALMGHGYKEEEAAKILGENHLRVLRETIDR